MTELPPLTLVDKWESYVYRGEGDGRKKAYKFYPNALMRVLENYRELTAGAAKLLDGREFIFFDPRTCRFADPIQLLVTPIEEIIQPKEPITIPGGNIGIGLVGQKVVSWVYTVSPFIEGKNGQKLTEDGTGEGSIAGLFRQLGPLEIMEQLLPLSREINHYFGLDRVARLSPLNLIPQGKILNITDVSDDFRLVEGIPGIIKHS